jgi:predicted RecB family nuclease
MRAGEVESTLHHSFWADTKENEEKIWRNCVRALLGIKNPQIFHFGSYETILLRRMRARYGDVEGVGSAIDMLAAQAVNVVSVTRALVFFPTFSNGLKDIASYLGFQWSTPNMSGSRSVELRRNWEVTREKGPATGTHRLQ